MPTRQELGRLYAEHRQGLFSLALAITRDAHGAEDAVHDAFARMVDADRVEADDPVGYAFRAVRNAAIDRRRRAAAFDRAASGAASGGSVFDSEPAADAVMRETASYVRAAIDHLPDAQRQTLVMRLYGGLTFEQIARTLDEPLGTVTTRYRRTLERIRGELECLR